MKVTVKSLPLPGFSSMLLALLMGSLFFFCIHQPLMADPDIGWHLRDAQLLIQQHAFLRHDFYTFSLNGHSWINPEWFSEVFFYGAWHQFGIRGIEVLSIILLETLMLGVCLLAWQRIRSLRPAIFVAGFFIVFASVSIAPRTQLFGWICLIVELAILNHFRTVGEGAKDALWALPILFALWINLHGSWPIGLVLLIAFLACGFRSFHIGALEATAWTPMQRKRLLLFTALSIPVLFVNPYGWHLVVYPFIIAGQHKLTLATVQEWQSLDFHGTRGRIVFLLVAALFAARTLRARTWSLYDAAAVFVALMAGFTYSRFLLLAGIVLCPMLAEELTFLGHDDPAKDRRLLNTAVIALVLYFACTHVPTRDELQAQGDRGYPAKAVAYLSQHPISGPLFNDFNWGGYLVWNLPKQPIFIDTRADVFEQTGLLQSYMNLINLKTPVESFKPTKFRYVLFPRDSQIVAALSRSPNWTIEYQDDTAVLLRRLQ